MIADLDPGSGLLSCGEKQIRLTEQARICLAYFCQYEGVLVTREALTQACWGRRNVVVTDATVRQTIFRLRKTLSEAGLDDETLQTVGKAGYQLTAGVIRLLPEAEPDVAVGVNNGPEQSVSEIAVSSAQLKRGLLPRLQAPSSKQLILITFIVILFSAAGFYLRFSQLVTPVTYQNGPSAEGRQFLVNALIPGNVRDDAIRRISFWLKQEKIPLSHSRYVYINGVREAYIVALTCSASVSDRSSSCRTLTILGDYHS